MNNHIKVLTKLELCNIFGFNVFRHTKDKNMKKKSTAAVVGIILLLLYLIVYMGAMSYGLTYINMGHTIPTFAIVISSLFIFLIEIFKASSTIFKSSGYDILCSFPLKHSSIVISRILHIYVEGLAICLLVFIPSYCVYIFCESPDILFFVLGIPSVLLVPLIPISLSILVSVLITGITCRMKYKNIFSSLLLVGLIGALMLGSASITKLESDFSTESLKNIAINLFDGIEQYLPIVTWFGLSIVEGTLSKWFISIGIYIIVFIVVSFIVITAFKPIYRNLSATSAKHNYKMQSLKQTSMFKSLCVKEFRRYFSSSAYVSNTIIGPIIAVTMTSSLFFVDIDKLISEIPFKINVFDMFPFIISAIFCMMSPICVSISMEGKNWWIVKTLPISTKTLLDSKILMNLILYLPFYVLAEILLTIATKPDIFALLWQLLIPIIILIFAFVFSLFINLHFPVFNWESETVAVKQSLSSFIGGLGCTIAVFIAGLIVGICPSTFLPFAKLAMCTILIIATIAFYKKIIRTNLKNIN